VQSNEAFRTAQEADSEAWSQLVHGKESEIYYQRVLSEVIQRRTEYPAINDAKTLALAHYRAGQYKDSLDVVTESIKASVRGAYNVAHDLAISSMSAWRLNRPDEARATLAKLRDEVGDFAWEYGADAVTLIAEAEALIEGDMTTSQPSEPPTEVGG